MKRQFFTLLRAFSAASCTKTNQFGTKIFEYSDPVYNCKGEFKNYSQFGVVGYGMSSKPEPIIYGNLRERELLQLAELFKVAASKEERPNYKAFLEEGVRNCLSHHHCYFVKTRPEFIIEHLKEQVDLLQQQVESLQVKLAQYED